MHCKCHWLTGTVILYFPKPQDLTLSSGNCYGINEGCMLTSHSMISDGTALPFTAHATSPTITMPRIKAMTTGSTPSFLDLILNFAESDTSSSLASQDTWLAQTKAKADGKMIMFGDDTWLKLFPDTFDRADGTSSFFVAVSQFLVVIVMKLISRRISLKWIIM